MLFRKLFFKFSILLLAVVVNSTLVFSKNYVHPTSSPYYFIKPASCWTEAIPIGNGRLGGMVYGGVGMEKIQLNDDTFWSGEPRNLQKPGTYSHLAEIRSALAKGNQQEAQKLIDQYMLGPYNQSYMPLADLVLTTSDAPYTNYKRQLNLSTGVVTVDYRQSGVNYHRCIFASHPDQTIIIRLTADKAKSINLTARFTSLVKYVIKADSRELVIDGRAPKHIDPSYLGKHDPIYEEGHGMRFEGRLIIKETDGTVTAQNGELKLQNATSATLAFVEATSYNGFDKDPFKEGKDEKKICATYLKNIASQSYHTLYMKHTKDFSSLYNRVGINLGDASNNILPIDERIKNYQDDKDPALTALYFQFGRYLLISGSRPGTQPCNLQGIWNDLLQPAWSSNWTLNCNAEINYWPAEVTNLSECHLPFMDMIRETTVDGTKTAKNLYNSRGWIAHHNLDLWRTTWPVGGTGKWAIFQVGSAWMCQHIWTHYLYTLDKNFLKEYYPVLHDAALFYVDNLQKDDKGYLVTNPSISFENEYFKPNKEAGWACIGSSQDIQMIRSLFQNTIKSSEILGLDDSFRAELQKCCGMLPPLKISPRTHELQEWNEDWDGALPNNGQVMQGWGLIEGQLFSLHKTPDIAAAFQKTLEVRKPELAENSGSWVGAFSANYWARLERGEKVQQVIDRHFHKAMFPNLTSQFFNSWQIDGNLGMTAAIANMLLQSQDGEINLLPALPAKYPNGYVKGLKAMGGYTVDIYWKEGKLDKAVLTAVKSGVMPVRYRNEVKEVKISPNQKVTVRF